MDRVEALRRVIDEGIHGILAAEERRCAFVHLYGVAQSAAMLALRRGRSAELAMMAGMLHDYFAYLRWQDEGFRREHGHLGAPLVRKMLGELGLTLPEETEQIVRAIYHHSEKGQIAGPFEELLKDADVLQHYLYNTGATVMPREDARLCLVLAELGIARRG